MKSSKRTQEQIVRAKLERDGFVSNLWAINRGIWRLGAVAYKIRAAGDIDLRSAFGGEVGLSKRHRKNYFYWWPGAMGISGQLKPSAVAAMENER